MDRRAFLSSLSALGLLPVMGLGAEDMGLQLGEGAGVQERTVLALQAATVANLGRIETDDGERLAVGEVDVPTRAFSP